MAVPESWHRNGKMLVAGDPGSELVVVVVPCPPATAYLPASACVAKFNAGTYSPCGGCSLGTDRGAKGPWAQKDPPLPADNSEWSRHRRANPQGLHAAGRRATERPKPAPADEEIEEDGDEDQAHEYLAEKNEGAPARPRFGPPRGHGRPRVSTYSGGWVTKARKALDLSPVTLGRVIRVSGQELLRIEANLLRLQRASRVRLEELLKRKRIALAFYVDKP